jgi:dolichol kinase
VWVGVFTGPLSGYMLLITWIALGATIVESFPFRDIDNITLTVVSALIGHLVF